MKIPKQVTGNQDKKDPIGGIFKEQLIVNADYGKCHACAIDDNGRCWVWGKNDLGQLGIQIRVDTVDSPRMVPGVEGFCTNCSCSDEATMCLVRKNKVKSFRSVVLFGFGDWKARALLHQRNRDVVSISCGKSICSYVTSLGELFVFDPKKDILISKHVHGTVENIHFTSCKVTNTRNFVLTRGGDCYEFNTYKNDKGNDVSCSKLQRVYGIKRASSIAASDKHAMCVST